MSILRRVAKAALPQPTQKIIQYCGDYFSSQTHRLLKTRLSQEMIRLEFLQVGNPLVELNEFPELKLSAWQGLQTLAYRIVLQHKPKVIVELGSHMGLSALAMALALKKLGEGGKLYAIDCWEGDIQAGEYSEAVYQTFLKRVEQLKLESTVVPLKMFFDEARDKIATPIDLLHIDGLHTWDAVKHDWDTFGPLVRPGGLILFHDVNTIYDGVRKFWDGLATKLESHTVPYSHGLGIVRSPG